MSDKRTLRKTYKQGELQVHWEPGRCIHSGKCVAALPLVFDPKRRPWIELELGETEAIVRAVENCPSGALSYTLAEAEGKSAKGADRQAKVPADAPVVSEVPTPIIQPLPGGPYLVRGPVRVTLPDGSQALHERACSLCRCGHSQNKPYCDGSHARVEGLDLP
jgi:uncharacterized Fe-S cluster protein YjdI